MAIVTGSNRQVRVVQGKVTLRELVQNNTQIPCSLSVRVSEIQDFEYGIFNQNRNKFLALLGWFVGVVREVL